MNTKVLPEQIKKLLDQPKRLAYLVGLIVVVALGAVLFLTVLRVQNQKSTIDRPQAAGSIPAWCTQPPSCCERMKNPGGQGYFECSWPERGQCFEKQCNAASAFEDGSATPRQRCGHFRRNTFADGTYACGAAGDGPFGGAGGGGTGGTGGGGGTGGTGQGCNPSSPAPVWSCYQNGINGVGRGNCTWCWAQYNGGGGGGGGGGSGACFDSCFQKTGNGTLCRVGCQNDDACVTACTGSGNKYLSCVMGCINGTGGGGCQVDSDCSGNKVCVDGLCAKKGQTHLECSSNACKRVSGAGSDQGGCTTVGASCGGGDTCQDSQCPTGQACFNNSCKAYHLGCTGSNVCAKLEGAGANTNGCIATGQVCGGELGVCWGNEGVNGRCVDCNGDGVINILDFSCLACNWSEKFTPEENPSCGNDPSQ